MHECRPEAPAVAAGGGWLCDTLDETEAVKIGCSRLEEKRYGFSHSEELTTDGVCLGPVKLVELSLQNCDQYYYSELPIS